jgi:DNA-binding transcriptional LysR family regulator
MEIDLKLLQFAVVLAKHRHFGRAASVLGISQPTLSRNIATLEKQVGVRVFERSRRDVVATPAGDDFLRMADELVSRAEAIANRLQLVRDGRGGRLRVASGTYVHDIAVLPAAAEVIRQSPTLRLELLEREWTAVLAMLMIDQVDFAVFDISTLARMPSLRVESLGRLSGVYFCRAGHPALSRRVLQPADLRACPFVMPTLSQHHVGMIDHVDTGLTIDPASGGLIPSIAVSSFRNAREIVERTDAISLGHRSQLRDGIAAGRLVELTLPWVKKLPVVEMGVAYKRERTLPPAARSFIALVRKHMRAAQRA